ncbi:MAG: hypothetical protein ACRDP3_12545, partial [Streptomyces sp.]
MSNGNDHPRDNPHGNSHSDGDPHGRYGYDYGYGYGGEAPQVSYPQDGWGGEYDADATGFVQLPAGGLPPAGAGADPWAGPLAAPGTGQGGYTPPPLDPADVAGAGPGAGTTPMTSVPTTDPGAMGQWAMPFGPESTQTTEPGYGAAASYVEQHAQQAQHQQAQYQQDRYQQDQYQERYQQPPSGESDGMAAAMGQGAAAALAGSHEARTQRRP